VPLDMTVGGKRIRHRKNSGTEGNLLEFFFHMLQGLVSSFLTYGKFTRTRITKSWCRSCPTYRIVRVA
jgi:hypothetical protein